MTKKIAPFLILILSALPLSAFAGNVHIIPVNSDIDRALTVFIRRGIEAAKADEAETIIFEINTFGGRVDSALQIATLIGSADAETVAYIPALPESTGVSWSAGALISFACGSIYMAPGTSMGAAAPVIQSTEGMEAADEKTVSAVRAQMAALAEKNGYPKAAALAMVDADIELIEADIDGSPVLVSSDELDLIRKETEERGGSFSRGRTVSAAGKLLTMTANEMKRYGVSSGTPPDRGELLLMLGLEDAATVVAESSGPDRLVALITGSTLTTILIMLGLGALYMEITSPGFGIPGTIAIIIFAVIFVANGMLGNVGSTEILLFIAGVVLLIAEIFLIPGFGAAGISGIILIAISLLLSRQGFVIPEFDWQTEILKQNLLTVGIGIFGSIIMLAVLIQLFPRIGIFSRLILESSQLQSEGFSLQQPEESAVLIGRRGTAATTLRPSGKADFDDEILVVETDGDFLEAGTAVEIHRVDSNRIIVRQIEEEA